MSLAVCPQTVVGRDGVRRLLLLRGDATAFFLPTTLTL